MNTKIALAVALVFFGIWGLAGYVTKPLPESRPYPRWIFVYQEDGIEKNASIDIYNLSEATDKFDTEHPFVETKCVYRHYYYTGCIDRIY